MAPRPRVRRALHLGIMVGILYAVLIRAWFTYDQDAMSVMTIGFLLGVPIVMGYLAVFRLDPVSVRARIFLPWLPVVISLVVSLLLSWEGWICVAMALPPMLIGASTGALLEGLVRRILARRAANTLALAGVLALPLLAAAETLGPAPIELRRVDSRMVIDANAATVWRHIASVEKIRPEERHASPIHWIGFPHPLAATLSRPGVGGVRRATFERGVLFLETVTDWAPGRALAFTFDAQTEEIPRTALDEHVVVGGEFFDVLEGRYEIVPLAPDRCELRLSSRHRLSTRINPYAALWSDFVMGEIQRTILAVIRDRCEVDAAAARAD